MTIEKKGEKKNKPGWSETFREKQIEMQKAKHLITLLWVDVEGGFVSVANKKVTFGRERRWDLTPLRPRSSSSCRSLSSSPPVWTNSRSKGAAASSTTLTLDEGDTKRRWGGVIHKHS